MNVLIFIWNLLEVFGVQFLFFYTLWNLYCFEHHSYGVFLGVFLTLVLFLFSLIRHWKGLREVGIRFDNLKSSLRIVFISIAVIFVGCFAFSFLNGTSILWPKWTRWLEFPLAGLLQQFIFLGYFFRRYEDLFRNKTLAVFLSATTFSLFHLANPPLMIVTFLSGTYGAFLFTKYRNLFAMALLHGWVSLALTMTLEPAGLIKSYKVGPQPMGLMKQEIRENLESNTRIGEYLPSRGIAASFQTAFDRKVDAMDIPHQLDSFFRKEGLALVAIGKDKYEEILPMLEEPTHVWQEYRVWLRKFPKRRSRTLMCVLTFNYKQLDAYYREPVLLISNKPRP